MFKEITMNYIEMLEAVAEGKKTIRLGDIAARDLAPLLADRLRIAQIDPNILVKLKRELRGFNMHTQSWSKQ